MSALENSLKGVSAQRLRAQFTGLVNGISYPGTGDLVPPRRIPPPSPMTSSSSTRKQRRPGYAALNNGP
jgi:hypothetical protein